MSENMVKENRNMKNQKEKIMEIRSCKSYKNVRRRKINLAQKTKKDQDKSIHLHFFIFLPFVLKRVINNIFLISCLCEHKTFITNDKN